MKEEGSLAGRFLISAPGVALILTILILLVYGSMLNAPFVWDDRALVLGDTRIRGLSLDSLISIFTSDFLDTRGDSGIQYGYYRPLVSLSYAVDFLLWGKDPAGFHLTNIFLHAFTSMLFFFVLRRIGVPGHVSIAAALIFALHPMHTESVSWVSGRTDILAALFLLCAVRIWIEYQVRGGRGLYWLTLVFFVAALLSKEEAIILPFLLLFLPRGATDSRPRNVRVMVREIWAFFLVIFLYLLLRYSNVPIGVESKLVIDKLGGAVRFYSMIPEAILRYIGMLLAPLHFDAYIQLPIDPQLISIRKVLILLTLSVGVVVAFMQLRRPIERFGIAIFFLGLIPVMNIVRITSPKDMGFMMAERFLYVPSLGFALLLASALSRFPRSVFYSVTALVLSFYSFKLIGRNEVWQDEERFFRSEILDSPRASLLFYNLGLVSIKRHDLLGGLSHIETARKLEPDNGGLSFTEGLIYLTLGEKEKALEFFQRATTDSPNLINPWISLSALQVALGDPESALQNLQIAKAGWPLALVIRNLLGDAYWMIGKNEASEKEYRASLLLDNENIWARLMLASLYVSNEEDPIGAERLLLSGLRPNMPMEESDELKRAIEALPIDSEFKSYLIRLGDPWREVRVCRLTDQIPVFRRKKRRAPLILP